jgi:uncharacterized Zn finger protein (UPF0148 family)
MTSACPLCGNEVPAKEAKEIAREHADMVMKAKAAEELHGDLATLVESLSFLTETRRVRSVFAKRSQAARSRCAGS